MKYGEGLLDRVRDAAPQGINAALDFAGTEEAINVSLQLVQNRSRIATIVAFNRAKRDHFLMIGGSAGQDPGGLVIRNLRSRGNLHNTSLLSQRRALRTGPSAGRHLSV